MRATHDYTDFQKNQIVKIDNMVEPTFVNVGTNDVIINGVTVKSGSSYIIGGANLVIVNTSINISFPIPQDVTVNQINKVRLFFNVPIKENINNLNNTC